MSAAGRILALIEPDRRPADAASQTHDGYLDLIGEGDLRTTATDHGARAVRRWTAGLSAEPLGAQYV